MTRLLRLHLPCRTAHAIRLGLPALVLLLVVLLWGLSRPLLAQGGCSVQGTPTFTEYNGSVVIDGQPAAIGTVVEAFNPQGVRAGCFVVNTSGFYGYMRVYGADANTGIPGMSFNQAVTFKINGLVAVSNPTPVIWSSDFAQHAVDLSAASIPTNTPTFTPVPPTNTPTFTPVPPTDTPTFTPVPPTSTPTFTPVPPTNTPTFTPVPPTNTPTFTPVPPTNTPTFTPVPPTNTPTFTPTPPTSPGSKTKSFQNGAAPNTSYSGAVDAYVSEAQSTTNFGTAASLIVSGSDPSGSGKDKWTLLKWNLSTITGIVQSASLTLNITDHSGGQTYELYEAVATWSETTVKWSAKPAKGTTLLGTVRATANGSLTANLNADGVAVVQKWLNTASKNYGFYLLQSANTDTMAFDSREKTTATLRPKLTVTYKPPTIISGPTVSALTATTATVVWETDTFAKSKIKYRKQGTSTWTTKSVNTVLTSGKWKATASLTGLTANTTYEYQVQASVDSPLTPTRTFRTLAAGPAGLELPAAPGEDTIWPSLYIPLFLNQ